MKILTKIFGEIEVSEKQVVTIKDGLFGFEDVEEYVLLDYEEGSPFYWLQARRIPEIAFLLVNPALIVEDYRLEVDQGDLETLEIESEEDILLFSIVTLNDDPAKTTINLLGPIVINKKTHFAKQMISTNEKYSVRQPLQVEKEAQC